MYTCISYKTTFNESLQVFSQDSSLVDFESVSMVLYCPVHKKKKKKRKKVTNNCSKFKHYAIAFSVPYFIFS